jgi:hypothetical protein
MAFVGLVTQKDKPTGVSLMAKVVTPNKKKSAKKVFKVSVKPNALDDLSCCVIDHGTIIDKINGLQDTSKIMDDITLSYSGINGTTVSYKIVDIEAPLLSKHLGEDGKLIKRPLYGEGNATGYIEVTVSKGQDSVSSRIRASVQSITALEVLSDPVFSTNSIWNLIRGGNTMYDYRQGIYTSLNLIKTKDVPSKSKEPVNITWEVEDLTLPYTSSLYTEPRIDVSTGNLFRPTYKDACTLVNTIPNITVEVAGSDNSSTQNRVRIGGLNLIAHLSLGDVTHDIILECSTISKYLTNKEVLDVVLANIYINTQEDERISYKTTSDSTFFTIHAPSGGGVYKLTAFGNTGCELFESPALKLKVGDISTVTITNAVLDFDGSNEYPNASLLATAFNNGFRYEDNVDTYSVLNINLDALKDANEDEKEFACGITISVSGYSASGDTLGGSPENIKRFAQIKVDTSSIIE